MFGLAWLDLAWLTYASSLHAGTMVECCAHNPPELDGVPRWTLQNKKAKTALWFLSLHFLTQSYCLLLHMNRSIFIINVRSLSAVANAHVLGRLLKLVAAIKICRVTQLVLMDKLHYDFTILSQCYELSAGSNKQYKQ